jgi:hypothetical protein
MDALAQKLGERLKTAGAKLVTAESCTGGWAAQVVTSVAGSSDWFERGFVTYSNDAKRELLGVREDTLQKHGAAPWPSRSPGSPALAAAVRPSPSAPCASPGRAPARCVARHSNFQATGKACAASR